MEGDHRQQPGRRVDHRRRAIGYSEHHQDNTGGQATNAFKTGSYASTNLLYTPAKNVLWGAEFLWGKKEQNDGGSAIDTRVQFTGQFKF